MRSIGSEKYPLNDVSGFSCAVCNVSFSCENATIFINKDKNKSNFFRANLILAAITFVFVFVLMFSLGIFFNTLKKAHKIDFEELEKTKFNYNITIEQRI